MTTFVFDFSREEKSNSRATTSKRKLNVRKLQRMHFPIHSNRQKLLEHPHEQRGTRKKKLVETKIEMEPKGCSQNISGPGRLTLLSTSQSSTL